VASHRVRGSFKRPPTLSTVDVGKRERICQGKRQNLRKGPFRVPHVASWPVARMMSVDRLGLDLAQSFGTLSFKLLLTCALCCLPADIYRTRAAAGIGSACGLGASPTPLYIYTTY
jgi:hypothetical protein